MIRSTAAIFSTRTDCVFVRLGNRKLGEEILMTHIKKEKVHNLLKILWGLLNFFCLQLIYKDAIFHGRHETWEMDAHISRIKTNKPMWDAAQVRVRELYRQNSVLSCSAAPLRANEPIRLNWFSQSWQQKIIGKIHLQESKMSIMKGHVNGAKSIILGLKCSLAVKMNNEE